jgi:AraC-like DNA-binding protein
MTSSISSKTRISPSAVLQTARSPSAGFTRNSDITSDFRQILQAHLGHGGLTAEDAANLVGMNRQKLARLLGRHGTNISAEIDQTRFEYARSLLRETNQKLAAIALSLGYSSPASFTRAFIRATGVSPRIYRMEQQEKR